jgi:hypothetical protein
MHEFGAHAAAHVFLRVYVKECPESTCGKSEPSTRA